MTDSQDFLPFKAFKLSVSCLISKTNYPKSNIIAFQKEVGRLENGRNYHNKHNLSKLSAKMDNHPYWRVIDNDG